MTDVAPLSTQTTELSTPPVASMKKEAEGTSDGENAIEEIEEMVSDQKLHIFSNSVTSRPTCGVVFILLM